MFLCYVSFTAKLKQHINTVDVQCELHPLHPTQCQASLSYANPVLKPKASQWTPAFH